MVAGDFGLLLFIRNTMANNIYLSPAPVVPGMLLISAISNANPMVVTIVDSIYNTYGAGQIVCLTVPPQYGMIQANELSAKIMVVDGDDFTLNVNSTNFDVFTIPSPTLPPPTKPASLAPAGSRNSYNISTDSFRALNGNTGN
jgi:hypothetical protein